MKATIRNINVEGTPEEVAQFARLMDAQNTQQIKYVPYQPYTQPYTYPWASPVNPLKWTEIMCKEQNSINCGKWDSYQVYN